MDVISTLLTSSSLYQAAIKLTNVHRERVLHDFLRVKYMYQIQVFMAGTAEDKIAIGKLTFSCVGITTNTKN